MATKNAQYTNDNQVWSEKVDLYFHTFITAILGATVVGFVNVGVIVLLSDLSFSQITGGSNFYATVNDYFWVGGLTEPIFTAMLPVFVTIVWFQFRRDTYMVDIGSMGWKLGGVAEGVFGIQEIYGKLTEFGNKQVDSLFFWMDPAFTTGMGVGIILHTAWGMYAGSLIGRAMDDGDIDRAEWLALIIGYLALFVMHGLVWNQFLVRRGYAQEILRWFGL